MFGEKSILLQLLFELFLLINDLLVLVELAILGLFVFVVKSGGFDIVFGIGLGNPLDSFWKCKFLRYLCQICDALKGFYKRSLNLPISLVCMVRFVDFYLRLTAIFLVFLQKVLDLHAVIFFGAVFIL